MSIDRLAAKVAAAPLNARGRRRYPEALKREVMATLAASGLKPADFAAKIGVPDGNLANWRRLAPRAKPGREAPTFKTVAVEPEAAASGLTLRAPGGVVLEGLSVAAAAELIAALSGRSPC